MAVQEQYNYHHANDCQQQQQHDLLLETSQRFPAAFYLLIQLGFRLHLEPSDNSHIPLENWDFGKLGKNLPPIAPPKIDFEKIILVRILPCGSELL